MTTCIISTANDVHAICVELALQKKNEEVITWHWWDFPSVDMHSVAFDEKGMIQNSLISSAQENISVWVHRGISPVASADLHPADVRFAEHESRCMLYGMLNELANGAFCVNPLEAVRRLRSKLNELSLATRCGLKIPPTLFSNDPAEIRAFFNRHGEVVMKHTGQMVWEASDGKVFFPYTTKVKQEHLEIDHQLAACPTIFQKLVEKAYELRIVFMGNTIFAAKIDSQKDYRSLDWRKDFKSLPPCSAFTIPEKHTVKIKEFIRQSGLIYGSIDVIVTNDGEYVFLEVNETGQFLWLEHLIPEFPLLDCFTNLLIEKDTKYEYAEQKIVVRFSDFSAQCSDSALELRKKGHVMNPSHGIMHEG
jgi:glutathione synthase/RimK-type ligase-like ATP-grasp enzyme